MIYTLLGLFLGGFFTRFLNKVFKVSYGSNNFLPSKGEFLIIFGCLIGAGIGFGYGSALLIQGTHFYNKIWNLLK